MNMVYAKAARKELARSCVQICVQSKRKSSYDLFRNCLISNKWSHLGLNQGLPDYEEGRAEAGTASAILSVVKYVFAAVVSPLVGLGNMLHSTAIAFVVITLIALVLAWFAWRLSPLADMVRK